MPGFRRLNRMQKMVLGLVSLVALLFGAGFWYMNSRFAPSEGVACTQEAKLCPDGVTYVGRQGPNCEFAACPSATSTSGTSSVTASLNQTVSANGVSIVPLQVIEDSRCPAGVYCIQAGTVRVKAQIVSGLGASEMTLTLGKSITTEAETITLTEVAPLKVAARQITPSEYRFTFEIHASKN